jgi:hypothetical protein
LGGGDEGQVDFSLGDAGQLDLGFLSGFRQPLQGLLVFAQVNAFGLLELAAR